MDNETIAWVISITSYEQALAEISEVSNCSTHARFVLMLNDENGNPHELGASTSGLFSAQDTDEVKALSAGLAGSALGYPAGIVISTFAEWLRA